ncbi:hypothetical protein GCM10023163_13950 [Aestuariibaculum suncheonense]
MNREFYKVRLDRIPVIVKVTSPPYDIKHEVNKPKKDMIFRGNGILYLKVKQGSWFKLLLKNRRKAYTI